MRDAEMDRRCENWARWMAGRSGGGLGCGGGGPWAMAGGTGGWREAVIPVWDCEAAETDQAIQQLVPDLRHTVHVYYLQPGGLRPKALLLGCSQATLHQRIDRAHRAISSWLQERRLQREAERERVEALARPMRNSPE